MTDFGYCILPYRSNYILGERRYKQRKEFPVGNCRHGFRRGKEFFADFPGLREHKPWGQPSLSLQPLHPGCCSALTLSPSAHLSSTSFHLKHLRFFRAFQTFPHKPCAFLCKTPCMDLLEAGLSLHHSVLRKEVWCQFVHCVPNYWHSTFNTE